MLIKSSFTALKLCIGIWGPVIIVQSASEIILTEQNFLAIENSMYVKLGQCEFWSYPLI